MAEEDEEDVDSGWDLEGMGASSQPPASQAPHALEATSSAPSEPAAAARPAAPDATKLEATKPTLPPPADVVEAPKGRDAERPAAAALRTPLLQSMLKPPNKPNIPVESAKPGPRPASSLDGSRDRAGAARSPAAALEPPAQRSAPAPEGRPPRQEAITARSAAEIAGRVIPARLGAGATQSIAGPSKLAALQTPPRLSSLGSALVPARTPSAPPPAPTPRASDRKESPISRPPARQPSAPVLPPMEQRLPFDIDLDDLATTAEVPSMAGVNLGATVEAPAMDYLASLLPSSEIPTVRGQPDSATQRKATPSFPALAMEEPPVTRRATDAEIKAAQDLASSSSPPAAGKDRATAFGPASPSKASKPPIRLGGLSDLPPFTPGGAAEQEEDDAEALAALDALEVPETSVPVKEPVPPRKPFDTKVHTRPTPPATRTPHTSSLRFPEGSLRDARNRRKTTKVNVEAVRLAVEAATEGRAFSSAHKATLEVALLSEDGASPPKSPRGDRAVEVDASPAPAEHTAADDAQPAASSEVELNLDALELALDERLVASSPPPSPPVPPNASTAQTQPGIPATSGSAGLRRPGRPASGIPTPISTPAVDLFEASLREDEANSAEAQAPRDRFDPEQTVFASDAEVGVEVDVAPAELSAEEEEAISSEASFSGEWDATSIPPPPPEPAAASKPPDADDPALQPILARFERGDYFGALLRAEALLEDRPDFAPARRYVEEARDRLRQMYLEKLGSGEQILRVMMHPGDIQTLSLDHRAGFLISLIDGVATIDDVLDMSGMPALDVLRLLFEMREQGVVAVDGDGMGGGPNGP